MARWLKICSNRALPRIALEHVPEELVVDFVMVLDFGGFYEGAEGTRATVGGTLFQIAVAAFYISAKKFGGPLRFAEIFQCDVNVVRQIAFGLAKVFDFGSFAIQAALENGIENQIRIGVRGNRANFDAAALFVADGDAHHGTAIHGARLDLVGRLEMRVQTSIGVDAGIKQQANVVGVGENAVDKTPGKLAKFFFALGIPENIFAGFVA